MEGMHAQVWHRVKRAGRGGVRPTSAASTPPHQDHPWLPARRADSTKVSPADGDDGSDSAKTVNCMTAGFSSGRLAKRAKCTVSFR